MPQPARSRNIVSTQSADSKYARRFAAREMVMFDSSLGEGERLMYLALDEYARGQDAAFPSQATLSERMGIPLRTVERRLRNLRTAGLIEARRRWPGGPNEYILIARESANRPPANLPPTYRQFGGTLPPPMAAPPATHGGSRARVLNSYLNQVNEERNMIQDIELTVEQFRELEEGYDRHLKFHRTEPRDTVLQTLMDIAQRGAFDWIRFRANHFAWCEQQSALRWNFCSLTFLAWVRAGMPPPAAEPGEKKSARDKAWEVA